MTDRERSALEYIVIIVDGLFDGAVIALVILIILGATGAWP